MTISDKWGPVDIDIVSGESIYLSKGIYELKITDGQSNFIMPITDILNQVRDLLGTRPSYLSYDIDFIDR